MSQSLSPEIGRLLLAHARATAEAKTRGTPPPSPLPTDQPPFSEMRGLFVTFHVAGRLRGCIGTFQPDRPLGEMVGEMAIRSLRDPRFLHNPIREDELARLDVELSVLSPMWRSADPLAEFKPGVHGVLIHCNGLKRGGCFLPQVATETGWNGRQMFENCCSHKAGLPPDAWSRPDADVFLFTAQVFSEKRNLT